MTQAFHQPVTDPTDHLNNLARLTADVMKRLAPSVAAVRETLVDPILHVTLHAPAYCYLLDADGELLGSVPADQLPATTLQAVARFVEGSLAALDAPTRRDAVDALLAGAEPIVRFRPLTGRAALLLAADGGEPVELGALVALPDAIH
jgi:hypothetical protein